MIDPATARELIKDEWERRAINGDLDRFMSTLSMVRDTGLAFDLDQHSPGISAIGFAFRDHVGDLHAISVPVPSTRFADIRPQVEAALQKTAAHIARVVSQT